MSSTSSSVAATGPIFGPLFTAAQWKELEHQALIYKYLVAGLPVPPDLVFPIRRSFESVSSRFLHHPSYAVGYSSYYGKKFDPEPGRCRRTDGKKWRCTKDAYPDSKYCERHMNRGRNRSRKHVESQSTSQSSSTVISHTTTTSSGGSGSFQNLPLHPIVDFEGSFFGNSISKLPMEPVPYGINDKEYRYLHGLKPEANARNFSPEASASGRGLKIESNVDSTWHLMPAQVPLDPFLKLRHGTHLQNDTPQLHTPQDFEPMIDAAMSKQRQQHCFFGSDFDSPRPVQHEHHPMRPFFDEWPNARDSWSNLDEQRSNKNTTQLSMSTPMTPSEFSPRSACSPNGKSPYNA